ncbi:hypothetical protein D9M69_555580 [compost metagenome]
MNLAFGDQRVELSSGPAPFPGRDDFGFGQGPQTKPPLLSDALNGWEGGVAVVLLEDPGCPTGHHLAVGIGAVDIGLADMPTILVLTFHPKLDFSAEDQSGKLILRFASVRLAALWGVNVGHPHLHLPF